MMSPEVSQDVFLQCYQSNVQATINCVGGGVNDGAEVSFGKTPNPQTVPQALLQVFAHSI